MYEKYSLLSDSVKERAFQPTSVTKFSFEQLLRINIRVITNPIKKFGDLSIN